MREEIAYLLIVLLIAGITVSWWLAARSARRNRRSTLKVDFFKKDGDR